MDIIMELVYIEANTHHSNFKPLRHVHFSYTECHVSITSRTLNATSEVFHVPQVYERMQVSERKSCIL